MSREMGRPSSPLADRVRSALFNSKPDAASAAPGPPCGVVELAPLTSEPSVSLDSISNSSRQSRVATNDIAPAAVKRASRLRFGREPSEAMTFTILVPNDGDEGTAPEQERRNLARRFADLRRSQPPPPMTSS